MTRKLPTRLSVRDAERRTVYSRSRSRTRLTFESARQVELLYEGVSRIDTVTIAGVIVSFAGIASPARIIVEHRPETSMNGARDDLRPGIRAFPVGDYLILYRGADVAIVRVVHGSRDLAALF